LSQQLLVDRAAGALAPVLALATERNRRACLNAGPRGRAAFSRAAFCALERWASLYLIAPALRFHPFTAVLLEFLRPEMEVIRIGLAESWRRGLLVMMRQ
jgi:hypothetical protein